METLFDQLASEIGISERQVRKVVALLEEGNTVPFIARYRKEQTGGLDDRQIKEIEDRYAYAVQLQQRKEEVLRLVDEQGKLTTDLKQSILKAEKLQQVEDLYLPYKKKRRTRATIAKEQGLEPLATQILTFPRVDNLSAAANEYIAIEKGLDSLEKVWAGVRDIIAEQAAESPQVRARLRDLGQRQATIEAVKKSNGEPDEKGTYAMYYDYHEAVSNIVPHRILALNRGEKDGVLNVRVRFPKDRLLAEMKRMYIGARTSPVIPLVEAAIDDGYVRLLEPSLEREIRTMLTEKAEEQAIHVFAKNLQQLLLQPPMKGRIVLGIDPAFRTGCKWAVVDETGKSLEVGVFYPTAPHHKTTEAVAMLTRLVRQYGVKMIAIGNGTASRETEQFVADALKQLDEAIYYVIVNEAGASVYSASPLAQDEFPSLSVEQRSAISIARRLQDPLAELVKIDPKSVGVGQYQHDVSQKQLNDSLRFVVETVVNRVGVNVNTASVALLQYVAGLNKTQATNIVRMREERGSFSSRTALKKVPRLGAKTYEQCIGFLRIPSGRHALDATAIHPESYNHAESLLALTGSTAKDIGTTVLKERLESLSLKELAEKIGVGLLTLQDIVDSLIRPGRDPRDEVSAPQLKQDVLSLEDLEEGMSLQGTVRNVVDFGAFVDIGVKQDGLVHISKLTNRFVKHPLDVVSIGDIVTVWVEGVDKQKGRVSLTMKAPDGAYV
ncbi:Tex family protein [Bacillus sp. FSL W7-1360]